MEKRTRIVTKIGYVFCVDVDNQYKRFFQYIADDMTMLNGRVIRVFKRKYPMDYIPNMEEIVKDEVDFYAHTIIKFGIQQNLWYKVGKSSELGDVTNILFRDSEDYGFSKEEKSYNWYIWYINQPTKFIGELTDEYKNIDIGVVIRYPSVAEKIKTGKYDFWYPH
jgi:hypothetical protein